MGASAVNGSFAERPSYYGYSCSLGEKRLFADHFFDTDDNIVGCKDHDDEVGAENRTSPTSANN